MGSEPGTQERPNAFNGVGMDLMKAITVFIAGIFAFGMRNGLMDVAPFVQASIDGVFIGVERGAGLNGGLKERSNRLLLHIGEHLHHHLTIALHHAQDRWFLAFERATPALGFEAIASGGSSLGLDSGRMTLVTRYNVDFVTFNRTAQLYRFFSR